MKTIKEAVHDYIELRRRMGYRMCRAQAQLLKFAAFLELHQAPFITQRLAIEWVRQADGLKPVTQSKRMTFVRGFARFRQAADPRTEIPAPRLFKAAPQRFSPYLYSDHDITALLEAARKMTCGGKSVAHFLSSVYYTLFGLLCVTGMRLGEACNLKLDDVDLEAGVLIVRNAKFGRDRLIALHRSTGRALADYIQCRRRCFLDRPCAEYLFVSSAGTALSGHRIHKVFVRLSLQTGLRGTDSGRAPRLHDMRHTFAMRTLQRWHRDGDDPERLLPILSTFLGHVSASSTYWYLENCPELMGPAAERLAERWENRP